MTHRSAPAGLVSDDTSCPEVASQRRALEGMDQVVGHLIDAAGSLGAALNVEQVAEAAVRETRRAVGAEAGALFVPAGDGQVRVVAAVGYPRALVERFTEFPLEARLPAAQAMREGRPVVLQTRREREAAYPHLQGQTPYGGAIVAWPLFAGERVVGALSFTYAVENAFGRERSVILEALAGQCAQALERASLYEAERTARDDAEVLRAEAELLFDLTRAANRASSLPELYGPALDALARGLRLERAAVLLFDGDGVMRFKAWRGLSEEYRRAVEGHSPWGPEERDVRPLTVSDVLEDETLRPYRATLVAEDIRALGFVPLLHEGKLLGKLMLYEREPRVFQGRELRLAEAIAGQIAQAAARARLFESERRSRALAERHAERMRRLQVLTAQLSGAIDPERVAEIVIDNGSAVLGALTGGLWLADEGAGDLRLLRASGYPADWLDRYARLPLERGNPLVDAFLDRAPVWLPSRREYADRYPELESRTRENWIRAEIAVAAVPLWGGGAAVGALAFTFPGIARFDAEERAFLEAIAQQAHQALERARLYRAEQSARAEAEEAGRRAAFLAEASALLSASLDYETTVRQVARLAVPRMADWCVVDVVDEITGGIDTEVIAHVDPAKEELAQEIRRRYPPPPDSESGTRRVIRTGASILYEEIGDEMLQHVAHDATHLRQIRELGMRSAIVVPVSARERIFGSFTLVAAESGRRYRAADLQMAEQLGRRIGVAMDNARLYRQAIGAVNLRDDFLSVAGHELKTPLTALLLQSELLLAKGVQDPQMGVLSEPLRRLQRNAQRISGLVDELLDVSRITSGRLELRLERVELRGLVRDVVAREAESTKRAGCTVEVDIDEDIVGCWDRLRLEQVVTNLFANALKYGAHAPIRIRARRGGDVARFSVLDRGIGVALADQRRIFERFERSVSSQEFGGLGLGLWIVRRIIDAHGGSIGVTSEPGQGAEFWVELPTDAPPEEGSR